MDNICTQPENYLSEMFENCGKAFEAAENSFKRLGQATDAIVNLLTGKAKMRIEKQKEVNAKVDGLIDEILSTIWNDMAGEIGFCRGCDLEGTHCEGSLCEDQAGHVYNRMERPEMIKWAKIALGKDRYNNLSLRMKKEILIY